MMIHFISTPSFSLLSRSSIYITRCAVPQHGRSPMTETSKRYRRTSAMQFFILIILMLQYATLVGMSIIIGGPCFAVFGFVVGFVFICHQALAYTLRQC